MLIGADFWGGGGGGGGGGQMTTTTQEWAFLNKKKTSNFHARDRLFLAIAAKKDGVAAR